MKLFQYSIIYVPEKDKASTAKILVPATDVLAETDQEALILAARAIPEAYLKRLSEVKVAVRPF